MLYLILFLGAIVGLRVKIGNHTSHDDWGSKTIGYRFPIDLVRLKVYIIDTGVM